MPTSALRSLVTAAAGAVSLASCEGPPAPEPAAVYVGMIEEEAGGGDGLIGLAIQDGLVAMFVCGENPDEYPGWFAGEASATGSIQLASGDWSAAASWTSGRAEGSVTEPDGDVIDWTATRVLGDVLTGLYAAPGSACPTGAVVIDGGDATLEIGRGSSCTDDGLRLQVTPLYPLRLVDGRLAVEVDLGQDTQRLDLPPVELPLW
jgi:hypothetical protein